MADTVEQVAERLARLETTVAHGFHEMELRFSALDRKIDVNVEALRSDIRTVAETVTALTTEMRRTTESIRQEHAADRTVGVRSNMEHGPLHRVRAFSIVGPYELDVTFDDGLTRRIDFSQVLEGQLFGPLKDLDVFNGVRFDDECYTLVWPNGADFDPATLHDWPEVRDDMIAMARQWAARG